ncbi:RNA polymerase sigma factor [Pedobacter sp. N23S346]|uniref:RNA polymerase sigma factor n=1 Tax=Pedobacter sp. N23S346 TaxID=3402750 RepID=UPI003AD76F2C
MSEILIASLKNDDPFAMEQIFNAHWEKVFDSAFKKLGDEAIAQDITQEIFISLWEKRKKLEVTGDLSGYLYGAVKHRIVDYYRSNAVKDIHRSEFAILMNQKRMNTADENLILQDTAQEVEAAMQRLPERMRLVISMSREQDKTVKEIAGELNVSVQTVKNQITAAMKLLRENLSYILILALLCC